MWPEVGAGSSTSGSFEMLDNGTDSVTGTQGRAQQLSEPLSSLAMLLKRKDISGDYNLQSS